ncbi:alpha/beta fold hydrolase [Microbacterium hominis]|uniref:alpha/beta fold hydrolase n=1 Tax=Microbacterium hominis TaxID=162426 RepID=UPI001E471E3E|nr:alpha/beta fold hydrolase [Microbacterium hominis]
METSPNDTAAAAFARLGIHHLRRPEGRVAYRLTGEGPLVVCVPGMGEIAAAYRYTVPALRAAGFRVAVMDLRGHGDSDATFSAYDDAAAGSDVLALIAHLGAPAVVVGTSMAAGAAVWAAAESPEAVRAPRRSTRSSATPRRTRLPPQSSACSCSARGRAAPGWPISPSSTRAASPPTSPRTATPSARR